MSSQPQKSIERILCPTNLSPESDEALRYAVALARVYQAKLFLCYCAESATASAHRMNSVAREEATRLFQDSLAPHLGLADFAKLDWEGVIVEGGEVGENIVREAAERGVDLIVMRSRRRPRAAALLGSTAETVCRTAPCPVLITHPQEREWVGLSNGEIDLKRVLVAFDFSVESELALRYGISLAQEYQAGLHLLHILAPPARDGVEIEWGKAGADSAYHQAARRLQQAVPGEVYLWCKVTTAVRWGRVYQEVPAYAKEQEIDLICMGANGIDHSFGAFFGSNVDRVLRQTPCPMLVARPLKPAGFKPLDVRDDQADGKKSAS